MAAASTRRSPVDVTVLARDIRTISAKDIPATLATMTIVGGKVAFDAAAPR